MSRKLLQVTTIARTLEAFLLPFATHFRSQDWSVDAAACGVSTSPVCRDTFSHVIEVPFSRDPADLRNYTRAAKCIRQAIVRGRYDIVHVHTPIAAFVTRMAMRQVAPENRPKMIYTAHGFHFYRGGSWLRNFAFKTAEKLAGKYTDFLVVINKEDEQAAIANTLLPSSRVRYVPGIGLDIGKYSRELVTAQTVSDFRAELGVRDDDKIFCMVAEFNQGKRHDDVLMALERTGRDDIHVVFAGAGKRLSDVRLLARNLGIESRVHFLGFRKDIAAIMLASVAVLLPSEREGLPRCLMEALALGVPVIGSNARGVVDVCEAGGGMVVDVGDVRALGEAMVWMAEHPLERLHIGEQGVRAAMQYDIRHVLQFYGSLYDEALNDASER